MDEEIMKLAEDAIAAAETSTEIATVPDWWQNPYLIPASHGYLPPNVPALLWWLSHPDMGLSHVRYNTIDARIECEFLHWDPDPHTWEDADTSYLLCELQERTAGLYISRANLQDALVILAQERKYDPLIERLGALPTWDGIPRAERLLVDLLGAEDTPYVRAMTLHMLHGAIMRAYHPGCKFDECVVLSSQRQGIGKSTLIRKLALDDRFFTDTLGDISKKDAAEILQGKWFVEIGELESTRKKEKETVKQFLSKQEDRYRAPYAKLAVSRPRRCVFVGTTNSTAFLSDPTGNRRFLPVECDVVEPRISVFTEEADAYIAQVWAEVLHELMTVGKFSLLLPREITDEVEATRDSFTIVDPKVGLIANWIEEHCHDGDLICTLQIMQEVLYIGRDDAVKPTGKATTNEVVQILDSLPYLQRVEGRPKHSREYGQQRCWRYLPNSGSGSM